MSNHVETILIIGIGMIGASIGLAAKQKGLKVYGYDIYESNIKVALDEKIIHEGLESLDQISAESISNHIDLIIISVPPKQTLDVLNNLRDVWNTEITITETCSVKNHIQLNNVSNIILSHPIAGSDKSGPSAADANLFFNKKNIICNPFKAEKNHLEKLENFWKDALQMRTELMSVRDHDLIFAMTSHLPHLIAFALIDSIRLANTEVGDNAGGGLKEFIRLSGSNPEMWRDIFTINRVDIIKALAGMQVSINNLLELITETKEIPEMFSHSDMLRDELQEIKTFKEDKF
tara:strand:+ start:13 stop:885 length:873 start_codon:yes stop_codon:yes gene_type:complete